VFQLVVTAAIIFIFTIEDVKLYAQQHMVNYPLPPPPSFSSLVPYTIHLDPEVYQLRYLVSRVVDP
jgi:hypothetical protein